MSKYTTEVRFICENFAGLEESVGLTSVSEVIAKSRGKIFDFPYPIFDEKYRSVLETKILRHFYTREIGLETVALWKLNLETKLNEIMPFFNQLYKSELLEFNPFYDVDVTRTHDGSVNRTENVQSTGSNTVNETGTIKSDREERYSDTPQGTLANVESNTYLTNAGSTDTNTQSSNNSTTSTLYSQDNRANNLEQYTEIVKGKQGGANYSDLLIKFRKTFLNIDMEVINALGDLFLNLW